MDVVYPLGSGSMWGKNKELRYSLRSLDYYLMDRGNIFVIGGDTEKLDWMTNVIHIPFKEGNLAVDKDKNIYTKILLACRDQGMSEDFLFMNDDIFLLKKTWAEYLPAYYSGTLREKKDALADNDYYKLTIANTQYALKKRGVPVKHFDIHVPIVYNKETFANIVSSFDWTKQWGYCIKSLYCNSLKMDGQPMTDCKINTVCTREQIESITAGRFCFSIHDQALVDDMRNFLADSFPQKSKYEL
jgi:hypothetical protein